MLFVISIVPFLSAVTIAFLNVSELWMVCSEKHTTSPLVVDSGMDFRVSCELNK